jgi:Ca-activated chloride channel family protein
VSWGEPAWLWGLLGLPLLAGLQLWIAWSRRRRLHRLAHPATAERLLTVSGSTRRLARGILLWLAVALTLVALARPRWGTSLEPIHTRGIDVVLAVDVSRSMLTEDVRPNRLMMARAAASELADALGGDRVGLIAFAGSALTLCPLTLDRGALEMYLGLLDTDLIPRQGTVLADAVEQALALFRRHGRARQVLVLITDGEGHEGDPLEAAREAAREGVIIHSVGVGTPAGEPIPLAEGGYKTDAQGNMVTSRLDEETLRGMAEATGGLYVAATATGDALTQVARRIAGEERDELTEEIRRRRKERYVWPLGLAVLLLALEAALVDRRRRDGMEVRP